MTYRFAATPETLSDYAKKLLQGAGNEQGFAIDSLQGTMQVDTDGNVTSRSIQLVYTVTQQEQSETFLMTSDVKFHQLGEKNRSVLRRATVQRLHQRVNTLTHTRPQVQVGLRQSVLQRVR